jgi:hypothetical protein
MQPAQQFGGSIRHERRELLRAVLHGRQQFRSYSGGDIQGIIEKL